MEDEVNRSYLEKQVQVWRVPLSQSHDVVTRLAALLGPEEKQRVGKFHFERNRKRYTIAQGALRTILSEYLEAGPQELRLRYGRFGKPYLSSRQASARGRHVRKLKGTGSTLPELHFNLSHCEDLALVAVANEHLIGVDIEKVRRLGELNRIVERYFSEEEQLFLDSVPTPERLVVFLTLWFRREATAKAFGLNLTAALSAVKVPMYPIGGSILLRHLAELETDLGMTRSIWSVRDLELGKHHVGALCSEGRGKPVAFRDFRLDP